MKAMVLTVPGRPLVEKRRSDPVPRSGELRIRVEACAVCRTDLHVVDGELPNLHYPRVPGHEIVGIHMSDIPRFGYDLLWHERELVSVANLTRTDGLNFCRLRGQVGIVTKTTVYPLKQANEALSDLRTGRLQGAAVLIP
ncbi:hypothetical protein FQV39_31915 (plasmid) [Bosea sp. F3-2]|uniref:alcohol dehydrogenase catalytic domain-containing protein n=1 Tax=Bosea sp. F3-2 TaxID=2599640 RepID=UPI0011EF553A|nr:alcohol dehydrogenase catalytic domain-containing protein [Bosea sp. F3-2]QEL27242.1 hypothetical protein FQV39_31915 [Bosea sp. F3-2]